MPEVFSPITIHELAIFRGMRDDGTGQFSGGDYADVGLAIMGGCERCGATLAAYNAHPTRTGFWRCGDCVGPHGYATAAEANADIFGNGVRDPATQTRIRAALDRGFQTRDAEITLARLLGDLPVH